MKKVSTRVVTALMLCGVSGNVLAQGMPWETQQETSPEVSQTPESQATAQETPAAQTPAEETPAITDTATAEAPQEESVRVVDPRLTKAMLNLDGSVGLQNMAAAWGGHAGTYRIALLSQFFTGSDTIRYNDTNDYFAGNLLFEASPIRYFSASLRLKAQSNVNSFGRPEAMLTQGDAALGLKGYYDVSPGFYLGLDSTFFVPTGFGSTGLDFAGLGWRPRLLASLDVAEMSQSETYLSAHFNLGYNLNRTENMVPDQVTPTRVERFAYGISAYDALEIGLGVDYRFPYVTPFLAWNLAMPVNGADGICDQPNLPCVSDVGFASYPNTLSIGVKSEPVKNLGLHLGMDVGLTSDDAAGLPVTLPWELVFGLQWTIDPRPEIVHVESTKEEEQGPVANAIVVGTVVDRETGAPVSGAIVSYPLGKETSQMTDESGVFKSYSFLPGSSVRFAISHPEYESVDVDRTLPNEAGDHPLNVQMKALPRSGDATGSVRDEAGNPISGATLRFTGVEDVSVSTSADGAYLQKLKPGKYSVAASAQGYISRAREIEVVGAKKTDTQFVLSPAPKEDLVELRGDKIEIRQTIFFDNGLETIQARSFPLLQQVTGVLAENPQVKRISIEGHTDDVGPDDFNLELSQRRAEAVRKYLIDQGISADRLVAKGFGESRPILPNTSTRNRSINRRVEFKIEQ